MTIIVWALIITHFTQISNTNLFFQWNHQTVEALVAMGYNRQDIEVSLSQVRYDDVFATYLLLGRKSTDVSVKFNPATNSAYIIVIVFKNISIYSLKVMVHVLVRHYRCVIWVETIRALLRMRRHRVPHIVVYTGVFQLQIRNQVDVLHLALKHYVSDWFYVVKPRNSRCK